MTPTEYVPLALRTKSDLCGIPGNPNSIDLLHAAMGLVTESAELLEAVTAPEAIDIVNVREELGDMLWYLAIMANASEVPMERFLPDVAHLIEDHSLFSSTIILVQDSAKLLDLLKKAIFYNKPVNKDAVDLLGTNIGTTIACTAVHVQVPVAELMATNIAKLRARFPEKFTEERAEKRDLKTERSVLEGAAGAGIVEAFTNAYAIALVAHDDTPANAGSLTDLPALFGDAVDMVCERSAAALGKQAAYTQQRLSNLAATQGFALSFAGTQLTSKRGTNTVLITVPNGPSLQHFKSTDLSMPDGLRWAFTATAMEGVSVRDPE